MIQNQLFCDVDVQATPARIAQEIIATKTMLDRVEATHGLRPQRLAADKAYGTGPLLGWLYERRITAHIPVLDRQHQTDAYCHAKPSVTMPRTTGSSAHKARS